MRRRAAPAALMMPLVRRRPVFRLDVHLDGEPAKDAPRHLVTDILPVLGNVGAKVKPSRRVVEHQAAAAGPRDQVRPHVHPVQGHVGEPGERPRLDPLIEDARDARHSTVWHRHALDHRARVADLDLGEAVLDPVHDYDVIWSRTR